MFQRGWRVEAYECDEQMRQFFSQRLLKLGAVGGKTLHSWSIVMSMKIQWRV